MQAPSIDCVQNEGIVIVEVGCTERESGGGGGKLCSRSPLEEFIGTICRLSAVDQSSIDGVGRRANGLRVDIEAIFSAGAPA